MQRSLLAKEKGEVISLIETYQFHVYGNVVMLWHCLIF